MSPEWRDALTRARVEAEFHRLFHVAGFTPSESEAEAVAEILVRTRHWYDEVRPEAPDHRTPPEARAEILDRVRATRSRFEADRLDRLAKVLPPERLAAVRAAMFGDG
ncbi:MAG: hypothetical protein ACF8XB_15270 [Planctomycetota bacterium JB042]